MHALTDDPLILALLLIGVVVAALVASRLVSRAMHWPAAGPLALLAATPFVPASPLAFHLTTDDMLPLLAATLLVWQQRGAFALRRPSLPRSALVRVVVVSLFIATLARVASAIANSQSPSDAFPMLLLAVGRPFMLVVIGVAVASAGAADQRRRFVATALAVVGIGEAIFSLIAFALPLPGAIGVRPLLGGETLGGCAFRLTGTLGLSPNHLGAIFVICLPLTIAVAIQESRPRWRWIWAVGSAAQAAALVLTFTRSSIILGGITAVVLMLSLRAWRLMLITAALTVVLVLATTAVACRSDLGPIHGPSGTPIPGGGIEDRFRDASDRPALWYSAALMMVDHPAFGVGLGRMVEEIDLHPARYRDTPVGIATNSAHNAILLAGAETGVVGAVATFALVAALALAAISWVLRGRRRDAFAWAACLSVLGLLAQAMFNNLLTVGVTSVLLTLLFGAFATGQTTSDVERQHDP